MVSHTLPFDVGSQHQTILFWYLLWTFTSLSFHFWQAIVPIILLQAYVLIGVRHFIYQDEITFKMGFEFGVVTLWLFINCYGVHLII